MSHVRNPADMEEADNILIYPIPVILFSSLKINLSYSKPLHQGMYEDHLVIKPRMKIFITQLLSK